jgi:thiol-disulfide isomerase/thioredoxin
MTTYRSAAAALGFLLTASLPAGAQDKPTPVTGKLPAKAMCLVCSQQGESEEEKPAGGIAYKGKTYYFCNKDEIKAFLKDPEASLPLPLPRPAPAFALPNVGGETVTLESLKGKTLLVDFWATWCGPCIKAMPEVQRLHQKYAGPNFSVVGIAIDDEGAAKVKPFLAKRKEKERPTYPMLLDTGSVWQKWGVKALPTMMLVRDGQIVRVWSGAISMKDVEKAVAETSAAR